MKKSEHRRARHGIRSRVLLYLVGFVAFVILLLWLFQIVFLDSFYRGYRTRQVMRAADSLLGSIDDADLEQTASRLAAESDCCILLLDAEGGELLSVEQSRSCILHHMSADELQRWMSRAAAAGKPVTEMVRTDPLGIDGGREILQGSAAGSESALPAGTPPPLPTGGEQRGFGRRGRADAVFGFRNADPENSSALSLIYACPATLADGSTATLLLNTRITPVSSTIQALRTQLIIITLIVLLGAVALAALISWRISKPIIATNAAARSLAKAAYERPSGAEAYREISELNDTLEKSAEELGKVEALQHELIANISHDLRTPLTMIGGYAEAMRDIPDENTPENMQIIIDETDRLSTLVNELLDFSRMQAGSAEMNMGVFSLTDEVRGIVGRIGKLVEKDGYTVVFDPKDQCTVEADATRIGQVVYNLIGNALTYTGADKRVTVTQTASGGRARIEVHDTGKGIAQEELPLIWNRYYRTAETHRRAVIGSGLGLNIVRSILEKHHAPYGVESVEGEGTTFWFELPLREPGQETN